MFLFCVRWFLSLLFSFFFFNDTATTEIYTLSLHDALPISHAYSIVIGSKHITLNATGGGFKGDVLDRKSGSAGMPRPISYAVFCLKKKKIKDKIEHQMSRNAQRHKVHE